jgi:hypothetical protein
MAKPGSVAERFGAVQYATTQTAHTRAEAKIQLAETNQMKKSTPG